MSPLPVRTGRISTCQSKLTPQIKKPDGAIGYGDVKLSTFLGTAADLAASGVKHIGVPLGDYRATLTDSRPWQGTLRDFDPSAGVVTSAAGARLGL